MANAPLRRHGELTESSRCVDVSGRLAALSPHEACTRPARLARPALTEPFSAKRRQTFDLLRKLSEHFPSMVACEELVKFF